jgi:hypothetical protein
MTIFTKIFGKGLSEAANSIGNLVDRFVLTGDEKNAFKLKMEETLMKLETQIEETYRTELDTRMEIIKAEMNQSDNYTKRARPTIVYAGLLFVFISYVLIPAIAYISGSELPGIILPDQFWWAWGTVVGVYGVGRSAEKMGITNKITNLMTGSGK